MKKALLAVAVLAASSSAFAATATDKHKVVIYRSGIWRDLCN